VGIGSQVRQGAATRDAKGEAVMGIAMLLKGENSRIVTQRVREELAEIQTSLPPGIVIKPFYDRTTLIGNTIATASRNLIEGGALVIAVLFLFLLQVRAGLIVSSAIPLSMLVAIIAMKYSGVSANLMSLGAIDFGLVVDGAVIIVENTVRTLASARHQQGRPLTEAERLAVTRQAASEVLKPALFGMGIIIAAYIPILTLSGIEGKMFRPMALTVTFALLGALVLSVTLIPALAALFLRDPAKERENKFVTFLTARYRPMLLGAMRRRRLTAGLALGFVVLCALLFPLLGSEFLPQLGEGALAVNHVRAKSVSLTESVRQALTIESILKRIPEVDTTVSRIGRPEIATDPMGPDMADTYAILKPVSDWRSGVTLDALMTEVGESLEQIPGVASSISQPIQFRMMELIEGVGVRSDVGIK
ncbi:MAG: CusA/CzcA family heavy metal efflux RND transporter, partial [Gemmatimonas sp.]|nr:CusA/CzcA family heavy metal efflux RND transporter [Gemmatimonas sp.]